LNLIKYFTLLIFFVVMATQYACSENQEQTNGNSDKSMDTHLNSKAMHVEKNKAIYYTCPMPEHKKIADDKPGKCSKCQMDLVAAVESKADSCDFYGCPMKSHSHVRTDKPGVLI